MLKRSGLTLNSHFLNMCFRSMSLSVDECLVKEEDSIRFAERTLGKIGVSKEHANCLATVLIAGDRRGHYSHGLNRLHMYINDIKEGITEPSGHPEIIKEKIASAWVNGNNILGPVVGVFCMNKAIELAQKAGIGIAVAKGGNHFGIAGYYSQMAMEKGLIGLALTNTSPLVVPTRGRKATLGTNPIAVAAPSNKTDSLGNNDGFMLDMATCSVAIGKCEIKDRLNQPLPRGWGVDSAGKETTVPKEVIHGGGLMPLGGAEDTSGYKGFGLAFLVEVLCGLLGGGTYGPNVRRWMTTEKPADLGQCYIAIDPEAFAPGFPERVGDLMGVCRDLTPVDPEKPVMVAGDPEREHEKLCRTLGGIPYHRKQIEHLNSLAQTLQVEPLPFA